MSLYRGFIAVDIPVSPKIKEYEDAIHTSGANVKLVEPDNIHITLKFLGDVQEELTDKLEEIVSTAVQDQKPFTVKLQGTGVFPNLNYIKVIWIGIEDGEPLTAIAASIDEQLSNLGFKKDARPFSPHLTIGRVRNARNKQELLQIIQRYETTEFSTLFVEAVELKQSTLTPQGPIYKTLRKVRL
jgi:2'-5' RNA ligase